MFAQALMSIRAALELLSSFSPHLKRQIGQAFVTCIVAAALWFVYFVAREGGDFSAAFKAAYPLTDSPARQAMTDRDARLALLQADLKATIVADKRIDELLGQALRLDPGVSRARLGVIHDGVMGVTGIDVLRFDITHARAAPGRDIGEMVVDRALSEWSDYLSILMGDHCVFEPAARLSNQAAKLRFALMDTAVFMACPVRDVEERTLGAVFLSWGERDQVPDAAAAVEISTKLKVIGRQIGVALDLRVEGPLKTP